MEIMRGFFRGFINSIIISTLFALIGVSLFVGDFPPSIAQLKQVSGQYKSLMQYKEKFMNQNQHLSTEELVPGLEQEQQKRIGSLGTSRGRREQKALDRIGQEDGATLQSPSLRGIANLLPGVEASETPPSRAELSQEIKDQLYAMRTEIFRLNQRVIELEKQRFQNSNSK